MSKTHSTTETHSRIGKPNPTAQGAKKCSLNEQSSLNNGKKQSRIDNPNPTAQDAKKCSPDEQNSLNDKKKQSRIYKTNPTAYMLYSERLVL